MDNVESFNTVEPAIDLTVSAILAFAWQISQPGAPATPDFAVSATPAAQNVVAGGKTSFTATATALNGFNQSVSFSIAGLPQGATATFNPASITGSGSSTVSIATSSTTPTGSFVVTITGTDATSNLTHTATMTLKVSPPSDFTLAASPASRSVNRGSSTHYTIAVGALNGFTQNVSLQASGLPSGAKASFKPNPIPGSGSSTLTISTSRSTKIGKFTLTIKGSSGTLMHSATVTLTVK